MRVALFIAVLFSTATHAGTITYEIVDYTSAPGGIVTAKGQKQQKIADVMTVRLEDRGEVLWSKSVLLDKGFKIGFIDSKDKRLTGFGMWVQTDPASFSWEWFNQDAGAVFKKLKEGGRVKVRTSGAPAIEEIAEIEFLTDISLRTKELGSGGKVLQRVNIKKGSVLNVLP